MVLNRLESLCCKSKAHIDKTVLEESLSLKKTQIENQQQGKPQLVSKVKKVRDIAINQTQVIHLQSNLLL